MRNMEHQMRQMERQMEDMFLHFKRLMPVDAPPIQVYKKQDYHSSDLAMLGRGY